MALEPNIILRAGDFKTPDYAETMERRAAIQLRNAEIARTNRNDQLAQAKTMRLGEVGSLASTGDLTGARKAALAGGDFDVLEHINKLEDQQRATLQRRVDTAAPLAFEAAKLPYEQRKGFIAAQTPRLLANGWTAEELANFDPSDQALGSIVASAQSISDMLKRQDTRLEFEDKRADRAADREFQRGNAYISAGLYPPDASGVPGAAPAGGGGAASGRTQFGWTPRARHGGDNSDAAVDNKIAGMAKGLGVDPDTPLTNFTPLQIAGALALSEGGPGSLADRNNNPGNLTDPKTGAFRKFPTKAAGMQAAAAQVKRNLARGQTTIRTLVEGLPVGGQSAPSGLTPIPGGKIDRQAQADARADAREARADAREERLVRAEEGKRTQLPKVPAATMKAYVDNNASMRKIDRALQAVDAYPAGLGGSNAIIPDFVKSRTDPKGVDVRSKVADIGSLLIHDRSGAAVTISETPRLKPFVPEVTDTPAAARTKLKNLRLALADMQADFEDAYSNENGESALKNIGRSRKAGTLSANIPTMTPEQARKAPAGTRFRTTDGRVMVKK